MSVVVPAIKGKMGSTEFYVSTMKARELVQSSQPAYLYPWWEDLTMDERMQREVNLQRIIKEIAPYFASDPDRFVGSVIITVYNGAVEFEGLTDIGVKVPRAYAQVAANMGFVVINEGDLVLLDGQHRWMGFNEVIQKRVTGPYAGQVPSDDVTVIFMNSEEDKIKTRKIFNKVNRFAKQTSKSDNLITSEDDAVAIICRRLMMTEGAPFAAEGGENKSELVNWKSNTISARSTHLTTLSALYEMCKTMLQGTTQFKELASKQNQLRPADEKIDEAFEFVQDRWNAILTHLDAYKDVREDLTLVKERRDPESEYSLLFKPAGQIAFMEALVNASQPQQSKKSFNNILNRANEIDWSMGNEMWTNIIVNPDGSINANKEARERTVKLMTYLLVGDEMKPEQLADIKAAYNKAKGTINEDGELKEELPNLAAVV